MSRLFKWFKLNFIGTRKELIGAISVIAVFGSLWYLIEFHGINLYDFWHECFNSPHGDSSECLRMSDHIIDSLFNLFN